MADVGVIYSFKALPRNDGAMEAAFRDIADAMKAEEFNSGGVKSFAIFRDSCFGKWWSYAHYTAEGYANHAKGPRMQKAGAALEPLLIEAPEKIELDPVIIWGCGEQIPGSPGRPAGPDPKTDVGVVYHFRVEPEDDLKVEEVMREIFDIMMIDEVSTGDTLTYTLYRDPSALGKWTMFEQFTAQGSADHATGERIFAPGWRQLELQVEPPTRVLLKPAFVFGLGEPLPA